MQQQDRSIRGFVVEPQMKVGLAGIAVHWMGGHPGDGAVVLGEGHTGPDGEFYIEVADSPEAQESFCRIEHRPDEHTFVVLRDGSGEPLQEPIPIKVDGRELQLEISDVSADIDEASWQELTDWLATNRMVQSGDLARDLVSPALDSPTRNWAVAARTSALRQMFDTVSAQGRTTDALQLLNDNTFLELGRLRDGNLGGAVEYFRIRDNVLEHILDTGTLFPNLPRPDTELYRDYLRGIWVAAARQMHGDPNASEAVLVRQLRNRFHQNFRTGDHNQVDPATLAAQVLRSALVSDDTRAGFGLAPAAVPAQAAGQSPVDYLNVLIALSGVSTRELRNRFRIRFELLNDQPITPVQLNVEALLGLLADTYQSAQEPFNAMPPLAANGASLIFGPFVGKAPFFLQYEEWLERQRFYPENAYNIRRTLPHSFDKDFREFLPKMKGTSLIPDSEEYFSNQADFNVSVDWLLRMFPITDTLVDALHKYDDLDYSAADAKLNEGLSLIWHALKAYDAKWVKKGFGWNGWNLNARILLTTRGSVRPKTRAELHIFEKFFDFPYFPLPTGQLSSSDYERRIIGIAQARSAYLYALIYYAHVWIPCVKAWVSTARGDFSGAIRALAPLTGLKVGVAETTTTDVYDNSNNLDRGQLFLNDTLPYTSQLKFEREFPDAESPAPFFVYSPGALMPRAQIEMLAIAGFEHTFFRLAQGEAMLTWADQLYRNDDPSSIRRARELYKGVLFLHGQDPDIGPEFIRRRGLLLPPNFMKSVQQNPALKSQILRARLGFEQIEMGLNAYGSSDDMVPVLRYKPLKSAADVFGRSAYNAQGDFLQYQGKYEQSRIDIMQSQNLVKRAAASVGIAAERKAIAQHGVTKAKEQVAQVQAEIVRKRAEAADADSFFGQAKAFFGGIKDSLTNMVPAAKGVMNDDSPASSVGGKELLGMLKSSAGGGAAAKDAAVATLGSGAALAIGFGAFAYYGYMSMESMAEAARKRDAEISALAGDALAAANAQVRLKERDVTITDYEAAIAEADLAFARELYRFQQDRFLNADFWRRMAHLANQLMRRYVELAARTAWQAERALAFEQNRQIDVIRLNYVPYQMRGVSGADRLLGDLAELEAQRIAGVRMLAPVKHTVSLAREFPLAFGALKQTGKCTFHTFEQSLRDAYPRTFGYRIRSLTIAAEHGDGPPPKGILRNAGMSVVSSEDGSTRRLARFADALPLSEFRLHEDLFVYGLPGETLMQFEGSGFETDWDLEFPVAANPQGLRGLSDIVITFDMNALYSTGAQGIAPLGQISRSVLLSGSIWDRVAFNQLRAGGGNAVTFRYDLRKLHLPAVEQNRTVKQIALMMVGNTPSDYGVVAVAVDSGVQANITVEKGLALTNDGQLLGTAAPMPLNALTGVPVDQTFEFEIDRQGVEDELAQVMDLALYVEYEADIV